MSGADAACANFDAPDSSLTDSLDLLKIRMPCAACLVVGVAYIITEAWTFPADITYFGH